MGIQSWGRLEVPGQERCSENLELLTQNAHLSRGLGRSYGDAALPAPQDHWIASTVRGDRILSWNEEEGIVRAEAGLSLASIHQIFRHRGWSSPTLPGTKYITLGGMVASDVHDKGHHRWGCFGNHIKAIKIRVASGEILDISPQIHGELFRATLGGMGLTGHILEVEFQMIRIPSPWIYMQSRRVKDIDEYLEALSEAAEQWPYTMGWIDGLSRGRHLGRGIQMAGRWALPEEAPRALPQDKNKISIPVTFPNWVLNPWSIRAFNFSYYWKHWPRLKKGIVHPDDFFHPLDALLNWNRIYGRRGFTQYQCIIPKASGVQGVRRFLKRLTQLGGASFLCVIKDCGPEGEGILSFPKEGTSIAIDMPMTREIQKTIDSLNKEVIDQGGRIYLAKDALTRRKDFGEMETRLNRFMEIRSKWDPKQKIRSRLSHRLMDA